MKSLLVTLALLVFAIPASVLACGDTAVCSDLSNSLYGDVEQNGLIKLGWYSDNVDDTIAYFHVSRFPTGSPGSQTGLDNKMSFFPEEGCEGHEYVDADIPGVGSWSYRVSVIRANYTTACYEDVTP